MGDLKLSLSGSLKNTLALVVLLQGLALWDLLHIPLLLFSLAVVLLFYVGKASLSKIWGGVITLIGITIFLTSYRIAFTVELAAVFLFLSVTTKLLELRTGKDIYVFVFSQFYLSSVSFLFQQGILQVLVQAAIALCLFRVLLLIQVENSAVKISGASSVLKAFAYAVPISIVCFMFFPRLAPLWSIPIDAKSATTGISPNLSPGDIASLSQSDERAFRVEFFGVEPPVQSARYWRGLVLDQFDGKTWQRSPLQMLLSKRVRDEYQMSGLQESNRPYYDILMDPHNQRWVFTLNNSSSLSNHLHRIDMGLYQLSSDLIQATRYRMVMAEPAKTDPPDPLLTPVFNAERTRGNLRQDSSMTDLRNREAYRWAHQLKQEVGTGPGWEVRWLKRLSRFYREDEFFYTLQPPTMKGNWVDQFLFGERRGFCAHYAGATAYMLRAVGIPARVIVGYQGGERLPGQDYLVVRQSDAHAWVEVQIDSRWYRIDPTSWVAPDRVLASLNDALSSADRALLGEGLLGSSSFVAWFSNRFDVLNYNWQKWVVNYGDSDRKQLFDNWLGGFTETKALLVMGGLIALATLIFLVFWLRQGGRANRSWVLVQYLIWVRVVGLFGESKRGNEGPRTYLKRIERKVPKVVFNVTKGLTERVEKAEFQR